MNNMNFKLFASERKKKFLFSELHSIHSIHELKKKYHENI